MVGGGRMELHDGYRRRSLLCGEVYIAEHASNSFGVQRLEGGEIGELLESVGVGVG
jgi:hypothetical protein